jgi:hypothetical protein
VADVLKSDFALLVSVAALLVSFAALYFNKLQPGRPIGGISYAMIWRFSNLPDHSETDFTFSPVLWITNVGVRPLPIINLRLRFSPENSDAFSAYPATSIPEEVIAKPVSFGEYARLTTGAPFRARALLALEKWEPCYKFGISKEQRARLVGTVTVEVQLKVACARKTVWRTVCTDALQFGTQPLHLEPLQAPLMSIPVYTRR